MCQLKTVHLQTTILIYFMNILDKNLFHKYKLQTRNMDLKKKTEYIERK